MIYAIMAVLILIIVILTGILISYKRQMQSICRQLQFHLEEDSNLLVKVSSGFRSTRTLAGIINEFLAKRRAERARVAQKEKSIAEIYTNLSHDIRTPLTSLDGYVQLLSDSRSEEEKNRCLSVIRERIACLKEMLEELFTFTKLKNDGWKLEMTNCCFNKLTAETLFSYYDIWKEQGIEPQIQLPSEELYFQGNESAYKRVLQNVIKNALLHGEKELKVHAFKEGEQIVLEIGNRVENGETIDVEAVFQRFYKADEARSRNSTGLGLAIAKELVERMDGSICAKCADGWFYIIITL